MEPALLVPGLLPDLAVGADDVVGELLGDDGLLLLAEGDVLAHELHVEVLVLALGLLVVLVDVGDVAGEPEVVVTVHLVRDHPEEVEPGI